MDPKLRPSFVEIGETLNEILSHLQEEPPEDKKPQPTSKGKCLDWRTQSDAKGGN